MCYCSHLVQIPNQTKVVIIQHPLEQKHPFNTGRMAKLCLSNTEFLIAETLDDKTIQNLVKKTTFLLYPSLSWLPTQSEKLGIQTNKSSHKIEKLVVIDASWRKSKKMLHLNPKLQTLPRLSLQEGRVSGYKIRKTSIQDGLSTIESIAEAMLILEPELNSPLLLRPFNRMIDLQQTCMGSKTSNSKHSKS